MDPRKPETKVRPVRQAPPLSAAPPVVVVSEPPPADIHFGVLLRRARERRGLSMQDVARVTRISDKWLPALEDARLDHLPAPVFVTGYVRSYARVVGLDEGDLVDRYHALNQQLGLSCPPARLPINSRSAAALASEDREPGEEAPAEPTRGPAARLGALGLALVALLVLGAVVWAVLRARGIV